jgi:capsular exopolysaccharide synthesis family protein
MAGPQTEQPAGVELRTYFQMVLHRKWTAIAVFAAVVAGVMALSLRQGPVYQAETKVLVPPRAAGVSSGGAVLYGAVSLVDESQIATSEPVAAAVQKSLGLPGSIQNLLNHVKVAPFKGTTEVLIFQSDGSNPRQAQEVAQAFANQYLAYRNQQNVATFTSKLNALRAPLLALTKKLQAANPHKDVAAYQELLAQRATLLNQQQDLQTAIAQLKQSSGAILVDAEIPASPARPNHIRDALLAIGVALVLGIAAAIFRDYLDDTLRGTADVERLVGGPLLGAIPTFGGGKGKGERRLIVMEDIHAPAAEAYQTLRTNLTFLAAERQIGTIVVTSPRQGEGKSTTVVNLAAVMAQAGGRILVADADLRRPVIHQAFGLANEAGLSNILGYQSSVEEVVKNPGIPGLRVVTGGPIPPNPVALLSSEAMTSFVDQVGTVTDWVIIDSPPVLGLADAATLASVADGVILVIDETTNRRVLAHARDQLSKVNAKVLGAVLNNVGSNFLHYYAEYSYPSDYAGQDRALDSDETRAEPVQPTAARSRKGGKRSDTADAPVPDLETSGTNEPAGVRVDETGGVDLPGPAEPARPVPESENTSIFREQ